MNCKTLEWTTPLLTICFSPFVRSPPRWSGIANGLYAWRCIAPRSYSDTFSCAIPHANSSVWISVFISGRCSRSSAEINFFCILALSQKHVRLFRCTYQGEQELQLRKLAPENLHVWMNSRIPDHALENRAVAGPSIGSMKTVMFGTSRDWEREDQYLAHFFKQVDQGIHNILNHDTVPLMLAGVETEIALYRRLNTHPHLMEPALLGSPENITPSELHDRAIAVIRQNVSGPLRKLLNHFPKHRDANRVLLSVDQIVQRASSKGECRICCFARTLYTWAPAMRPVGRSRRGK